MRFTELRISSFFVLFAAIFLFAITGLAQRGLTIVVKDSNGAIVPGAEVTISGKSILYRTRETDIAGNVNFDGVLPGEIIVVVEADSFPRTVRSVSFSGGQPIEIVLMAGGVSETVTVTAARTQLSTENSTSTVSVIDRLGIERRSLNSIGDLFRSLAGTSTNNEGAFQVRPRVRGLESNRVLILVDGDRLRHPFEVGALHALGGHGERLGEVTAEA